MAHLHRMPALRLAYELRRCTEAVALCLLSIGLLNTEGDDESIAASYAALAESYDPLLELSEHWALLRASHPLLAQELDGAPGEGVTAPLTDWLDAGIDSHRLNVQQSAWLLSTISFSHAEADAQDDLLGRVLNQIHAMSEKRGIGWTYMTRADSFLDVLASTGGQPALRPGRGFADTWCGSGMRVLAIWDSMAVHGLDASECTWHVNDPDRFAVAITAVNFVAAGLPGRVVFTCRREMNDWHLAQKAAGHPGLDGLMSVSKKGELERVGPRFFDRRQESIEAGMHFKGSGRWS